MRLSKQLGANIYTMKIVYSIDENDMLLHQLFVASKSKRILKKRQRSKIIIPLIYVAFSFYFILKGDFATPVLFIVVAIIWFFVYPLWESRHYVKHYKSFIKENLSDRIDRDTTFEFSNDHIWLKDIGNESKVLTTEIEDICEIPLLILVRLKGGQSIIFPKNKIVEIDALRLGLIELAKHLEIKYEISENWKWK